MLALLASMTAAFVVVYGTGRTVNDKIRLVNAADAAALSAAQWQARSLNFQAYINRAKLANELAIAQLVSLRSWSDYLGQTIDNADMVLRWVPAVNVAMRALERGWDVVDRTIQSAAPPLEQALSIWNVDALTAAQSIAHAQGAITAANLVSEVTQLNEPRAVVTEATRLLQARNGAQWLNQFTERAQRGGGDLRRFTRLLNDTRDGFTRRRTFDPLPSGSPVQLSRRGGTDLLGEYSWRGVDSFSTHIDFGFFSSELPIGWGAAEQRQRAVTQRGEHGGSRQRNPRATRLAERSMNLRSNYRGVPEIRDVRRPARQDERRLRYAVNLLLPAAQLQSPDRLLGITRLEAFEGGQINTLPEHVGGGLQALASAEVYFQRPTARRDGRQEFASLFSPYWQARLTEVSAADRLSTARLRGLVVDPWVVAP